MKNGKFIRSLTNLRYTIFVMFQAVQALFTLENSTNKFVPKEEPFFSIITPLYNVNKQYFLEMLQSVDKQTYCNYELCIADASDNKIDYLSMINKLDNPRIKYVKLEKNEGIAENTNRAVDLSTGEYLVFLDHDDRLSDCALYELSAAIKHNPGVEYLYSDEDQFSKNVNFRKNPFLKPDYSPENLLGLNYICHLVCIKKLLFESVGRLRGEFNGSQDYDLALRATSEAKIVIHIPKVLYHWRVHKNSVAYSFDAKDYAQTAAINALSSYLRGLYPSSFDKIIEGKHKGRYIPQFRWLDKQISIVIYNDNSNECITAIQSLEHVFNDCTVEYLVIGNQIDLSNSIKFICEVNDGNLFESFNKAVQNSQYEQILFWHSSMTIIDEINLKNSMALLNIEKIACIGPSIVRAGSETILTQGYSLSQKGIRLKLHGFKVNERGYFDNGSLMSTVEAIGYFGMITRKSVFTNLGGFNRGYFSNGADIEYCLKATQSGMRVVSNPLYRVEIAHSSLIEEMLAVDIKHIVEQYRDNQSSLNKEQHNWINNYYSDFVRVVGG